MDVMTKHDKYQRLLSRIEGELKRTGDLNKAISRISWSAGIPIWWLEKFAPTWALQAEKRELNRHDNITKREIRSSKPRQRTSGSVRCFRFSLPRAEIRDEDEFYN